MAGFAEKNSLYVSQAPGEHQGPLLTLGANHRKRPSTFQGHRPACPAGTPAGRLDRGGAVLEREWELYLQRLSELFQQPGQAPHASADRLEK